MSETKEEVRYVMLYEWKKGNNAHNTTKIITQIFGDVVPYATVYRWFRRFESGDLIITDWPRSGRPIEVDNDVLKGLIEADPRLTTRSWLLKWSAVMRQYVSTYIRSGKCGN